MRNGQQFHHIQKSIILFLANTSPARFSELQPPRIPNNVFSYHLKKLLDSGYIELTENGYIATRKALKLVEFGVSRDAIKTTPSVISMICVLNDKDEMLLVNRNNRPFQGWYGIPSGVIHSGESLQDAARRELFEKTTLTTTEDLEEVGVLDFRYLEKETNDMFIHVIAFVYVFRYAGDASLLNDLITKYGQLSWSTLKRSHILPEVFAVKDMMETGKFQHSSQVFVEPTHMAVFDPEKLSQ